MYYCLSKSAQAEENVNLFSYTFVIQHHSKTLICYMYHLYKMCKQEMLAVLPGR